MRSVDLAACRQRLLRLGFAPTEVEEAPGFHLPYRSQEGFRPSHPFASYTELHRQLAAIPYYIRRLPMDRFWDNSEPVQMAGHQVCTPSPTANLIYLSAHLALHHPFRGLRWFMDLAPLSHHHSSTVDWQDIARRAQAMELLLVPRARCRRLADP